MAWAHAKDLGRIGATVGGADARLAALGDDAGGLRRDRGELARRDGEIPPHFAISETPRFVGRAVAALAADPERRRWNGQSLSSGELAQVYGFTDLDGSRPDAWRYDRRGPGRRKAGRRHRLPLTHGTFGGAGTQPTSRSMTSHK